MENELRRLQEEVKALREEQQKMGERLKVLDKWVVFMEKSRSARETASPPARTAAPTGQEVAPAAAPLPAAPPPRPRAEPRDLEAKIGGIWLNRIGMVVFLLGAAFFLKLAYDWGWINETVRIAIGAAVAAVLLGLGERNRRRGFTAYGQGLTGGGIALLYFTIFASFYYYHLIDSTAGLGLLIVVTIGAVLLAVYHDAPAVAVIGLITAFLNPILFMVETPRFVLLMIYLILLNLGIIAVVYLKGWNFIRNISFILTGLLMTWVPLYRHFNPATGLAPAATQIYFTAFLLLFLSLPLLNVTLRRRRLQDQEIFIIIVGAIAYYALGRLNLNSDFPHVISWFTLSLAGFYLLAGWGLLKAAKHDPRAHFTAFAIAAVLLVIFVPLQLKDAWVLAGWSLQAALLCYLGLRLADKRIRGGFWALLSLALLRLLITEWPRFLHPEQYRFLINRTALLTFGFIAFLILLSLLFHRFRQEDYKLPVEVIILAGSAALLLLIFGSLDIYRFGEARAWITGNSDYYHNLALLMISLFWGVYAAALMAAGFLRKIPMLRYTAIALFGLTVAKVILVDLSFLDLAYRIISLVALGLILLAVSYLYQRHRSGIDPAAGAENND